MSIWKLPKKFIGAMTGIHQLHFKNSMYKLIIYNPSTTFYMIWKIVSVVYNKKYLERVRIIKKTQNDKLWEILDPDNWEKKFGGNCEDLKPEIGYWPPKC